MSVMCNSSIKAVVKQKGLPCAGQSDMLLQVVADKLLQLRTQQPMRLSNNR
jgi:hypothetical protein